MTAHTNPPSSGVESTQTAGQPMAERSTGETHDSRMCIQKWPDRESAALCINLTGHGFNVMVPLMYFRRAKHTPQWIIDDLIAQMSLHVPEDLADRIADATIQDVEAAQ